MTEQEPQLPEKLRKALKAAPTLTPPESFYRAVLDRIERKTPLPASRAPWYWGWPARALATACVVMIVVVVARETRRTEPQLYRATDIAAPKEVKGESRLKVAKVQPPLQGKGLQDLGKSKAVDDRLHRDISGMVGRPSPFEDLDENAPAPATPRVEAELSRSAGGFGMRQDLAARKVPARTAPMPAMAEMKYRSEESIQPMASAVAGSRPDSLVPAVPSGGFWQGKQSGIHEFRTVTITTPHDWQTLWAEHTQSQGATAPPLDFTRVMVVGVFLGDRPHPGYGIDIVSLKTLPDQLAAEYQETLPDPIGIYPQVIAQPFVLKIIPRTTLPVHFHYLRPKSHP